MHLISVDVPAFAERVEHHVVDGCRVVGQQVFAVVEIRLEGDVTVAYDSHVDKRPVAGHRAEVHVHVDVLVLAVVALQAHGEHGCQVAAVDGDGLRLRLHRDSLGCGDFGMDGVARQVVGPVERAHHRPEASADGGGLADAHVAVEHFHRSQGDSHARDGQQPAACGGGHVQGEVVDADDGGADGLAGAAPVQVGVYRSRDLEDATDGGNDAEAHKRQCLARGRSIHVHTQTVLINIVGSGVVAHHHRPFHHFAAVGQVKEHLYILCLVSRLEIHLCLQRDILSHGHVLLVDREVGLVARIEEACLVECRDELVGHLCDMAAADVNKVLHIVVSLLQSDVPQGMECVERGGEHAVAHCDEAVATVGNVGQRQVDTVVACPGLQLVLFVEEQPHDALVVGHLERRFYLSILYDGQRGGGMSFTVDAAGDRRGHELLVHAGGGDIEVRALRQLLIDEYNHGVLHRHHVAEVTAAALVGNGDVDVLVGSIVTGVALLAIMNAGTVVHVDIDDGARDVAEGEIDGCRGKLLDHGRLLQIVAVGDGEGGGSIVGCQRPSSLCVRLHHLRGGIEAVQHLVDGDSGGAHGTACRGFGDGAADLPLRDGSEGDVHGRPLRYGEERVGRCLILAAEGFFQTYLAAHLRTGYLSE